MDRLRFPPAEQNRLALWRESVNFPDGGDTAAMPA
jgi:hypothetical protein